MRQVRKGGKSEKEAFSRVEKKHYKTVCESRRSFKYHREIGSKPETAFLLLIEQNITCQTSLGMSEH